MKRLIFIVVLGLMSAGCRNPYLSLTETNEKQIEAKIIVFQKQETLGAEATLLLKDGEKINGELLSIRDSTVTMCTEYSATEKELANLQYPIHIVRTDKIREITLEGSNYRWIGLGIGAVAGIGLGILVAENYEPSEAKDRLERGFGKMFIGAMVGLLVAGLGRGIGAFASTDEVILYEIPPSYKLLPLKSLARYPDEEPEYLKAIDEK